MLLPHPPYIFLAINMFTLKTFCDAYPQGISANMAAVKICEV
jgi:hypothetical protein